MCQKIFFYLYPWTQVAWEIRGKVMPLCVFNFFYLKNAWGGFFFRNANQQLSSKMRRVIDGCKIILLVCWGYSQRTTPEIRPRIPAIVRATCPPQATELHRREDGASVCRVHTHTSLCNTVAALCNIQEMSGTACSATWSLRSSSDLLSDRLSPCNLETTRNT